MQASTKRIGIAKSQRQHLKAKAVKLLGLLVFTLLVGMHEANGKEGITKWRYVIEIRGGR